MSKLNISKLTNENEDGAPKITGISTFSSNAFVEVPKGSTAKRPEYVSPGMIRFNTDSGHLEYYNGVEWTEVLVANNTLDGGARGIVGARATPAFINNIEYFTISTLGNGTDFGDMSSGRYLYGCFASSTRGVFTGGNGTTSRIESITISSTGNAIVDSGTLVSGRYLTTGCSNSTRGLTAGGFPGAGALSSIEYTTIASLGNAQTFGDLNEPLRVPTAYASSTRGVFAGGYNPSPATVQSNVIQYVTISTTGNTIDFGDLVMGSGSNASAVGSSTRAVFGGFSSPSRNNLDFITISSTGDSQDFGDLYFSLTVGTSFSSVTRGCFAGGLPGNSNVVQSISIPTTGDSVDFGDLINGGHGQRGCSNGHGGL